MAVEDLSLDFTLPGYAEYALASKSAKMVIVGVGKSLVLSCHFHYIMAA